MDEFLRIDYEAAMLPGYTWLFPAGAGRANVGILTFDRYQSPQQTRERFERQVRGSGRLAQSLRGARLVPGSIKGGVLALGSARHPRGRRNAILIGDAGSFVDPLAGEGIYYALRTGELAAEVIEDAVASGTTGTLAESWAAGWRRTFDWSDFRAGVCLRSLMRSRTLFNGTVNVLRRSPARADAVLGVLGHALPKSRLLGAMLGGRLRYGPRSSPSSAAK
jgi:flavin-dependent dehydrogenase